MPKSVRDGVLAVSGKLDLTMGGPSAEQFWFKDDHSPVYDYSRFDVDSPASYRRSIYRFIVRSVPDPFMDRLDCPDASLITAKRNTTITAIQALALLNNPFMVRQAEHLAARVEALAEQPGGTDRAGSTGSRWGAIPSPAEARAPGAFAAQHGLENAAPRDLEQQRVSVCGLRTHETAASFSGISAAVWAASRWRRCSRGETASSAKGQTRRATVHVRRRQPVRHLRLQARADPAQRREVRPRRQGGAVPKQPGRRDEEPVGLEAARPMRQVGQRSGAAHRVLRRTTSPSCIR